MYNFVRRDRQEHGCCKVTKTGCEKLKCICLDYFMSIVRKGDKNESWNKHRETFLMFSRISKRIVNSPLDDPDTLAFAFDKVAQFKRQNVKNMTPAFTINTPSGRFIFCWNGFFEMGGHAHKMAFNAWYGANITRQTAAVPPDSVKHYLFKVVQFSRINSEFFFAYLEVCGKKERLPHTLPLLLAPQVIKELNAQDHYPADKGKSFAQTARQFLIPRCQKFLHQQMGDFLVVADERIPNVEPLHQDVHGMAGGIVFRLHGTPSSHGILHMGDAGVFPIQTDTPLFREVLSAMVADAGHAFVSGDRLQTVNDNNKLRYLSPVNYKENGVAHLLDTLGVPQERITELHPDAEAFHEHVQRACVALLPKDMRATNGVPKKYISVMTTGVLVSVAPQIAPFDSTWPTQNPHRDFTARQLNKMEQMGVKSFLVFVPLKEEGMFLRIWEHINLEDPAMHKGRLVHVRHNRMFVAPAQLIHAGGFRTSMMGNPRVHCYIYLWPEPTTPAEASALMRALPKHQYNDYIGLEAGDTSVVSINPPETHERKARWFCPELEHLRFFMGF